MLELGMTYSLEQFLVDNDIISMIKRAMDGIPVTQETLAVDSIIGVGAGNNFLAHKSSRENIGMLSNPLLFDRNMYGDWARAGEKDILTAAREKSTMIMNEYEPSPIDSDILKDMWAVVEKSNKEYTH
jgi:trimethylamine--corrinoid protein Co-methyltransferase